MFKFPYVSFVILVSFFLFPLVAGAGNYFEGALLRAERDIKVYLISNKQKHWVSSIEVFNLNKFKWQNIKVVPKKEITAIEEGEPVVLEKISPSALPSSSPTPIVSIIPTPPVQAKINEKLPAPEYLRADWLVSYSTSNYGRVGQRITFKYSDKEKDRIENFILYEKRPGDIYFKKIANFEEVSSIGCEDIDIDGEWMMTEAGQCGYWSIQKTVIPGGRGVTAYLPATDYLVGEYVYYVAGTDRDGLETPSSPEARLVFVNPVDILSPTDDQQTSGVYPVFKWSIANDWPISSIPDYFISISDNEAAQNPLWGKQIKAPTGISGESVTYDGLGLDPTKKYKVYIYGHYRKSEYDPDYISIPLNIPEFQVKASNPWVSFRGFLKALFLEAF